MMKTLPMALVLFLGLAACASHSPKPEETPKTPPAPTPALAVATTPSVDTASEEPMLKMIPAKPRAATTVVAGPDRATPHFKTHTGVDPEKALGWMKNGNKRFVKGYLRRDGQSKKDIARLVKGQKPHTIVLSCSDSRVPPEVVFDQKLGEIYTIRTSGEALDDNVIGSVEYAIEHLGVRLVLVMGHTSCSTVRAALGTLKGGDTGTPALNAIVADMHPRLQSFIDKPQTADLGSESLANAEGIVSDLVKRSSLIREAFDGGDVDIRAALYDLKDGVVTVK